MARPAVRHPFLLGTVVALIAAWVSPTLAQAADPTGAVLVESGNSVAQRITLTPGRVAWRDDATTAQPVYSRSLSSSNGALTVGPRTQVATGASGREVAASGLRNAYFTGPEAGYRTLVVTDGTTSTEIPNAATVQLSGSRVSYLRGNGTAPGSYRVLDLRTQRTVDTTSTLGASTQSGVALWGDYYAYSKADGSLWRKDLSSSAPAVQVAPKWGPYKDDPNVVDTNFVYMWGDWVAYTHTSYEDIGPVSVSNFRNMRTQSPETQIGQVGTYDRVVGASAGGIEFSYDNDQDPYELIGWDNTSTTALPTSSEPDTSPPNRVTSPPAIDGSTVAWIGADGLPRVAPLGSPVVNRPRALGTALASSTLTLGGTWRVELPTSAALTSCQVSLTRANGGTIRTLPCSDAAAAQGEAVADWDGKDADGDAVAPGTYTWTVTAVGDDGSLLAADGSTVAVSGAVSVLAPSLFHPLASSRVLDTRSKLGGSRPAGRGTVGLPILGRGGVPATGVASVVLNLTVTHPASSGFVTAYPGGTSRPGASNLNFVAGQTVPNLVTVPVGANGRIDLYNGSTGATDLVADVAGYYAATPSATPGAFVGTSPSRLLDTRSTLGAQAAAASRGTVALDVAGHGPVPASGVSAVLLNVTATGSASPGYLTVHAGGTVRPTASNLNYPAGRTVPNLVVAPVGSDGRVDIYNGSVGATQVIADVVGYYLAGMPTQSGAFVTTAPTRLLDTRSRTGGTRPGPHGTLVLQVAGQGPVPAAGAGAAVLNVTAADSTVAGFVTVYGHGSARPNASNLNYTQGQSVPNLVASPLGDGGRVDLYNGSTGPTELIADLAGYFLA